MVVENNSNIYHFYFEKGESVSKNFIYEKLKVNKYQLAITKRNIKKKILIQHLLIEHGELT